MSARRSWRRSLPIACCGAAALLSCERSPAPGAAERSADAAADGRALGEIRIAAASDLRSALDELVGAYWSANPGVTITVSYGSSGNLYSQLANRAPFDLFLSADMEYPRRLVEAGLAMPESLFEYGRGRLVVWMRNDSPVDPTTLGIEALAQPSVRTVAIANPEHAPYGRAAMEAFESLGVIDRVRPRLVRGESVSQAAQFVDSGAADAAVLALSLASGPGLRSRGRSWQIPESAHRPLVQGGVVLPWANDPAAAMRFREFMTGPRGRSILARYGYDAPS